jgi:ABC-type branched-subunit amino acid transport system substrate-binding protein
MNRRHALTRALALIALHSAARGSTASDEIVIGRTVVLSGPLRIDAQAKCDGADALFATLNAAGGIGGQKIRVVTLDDGYKPETTVANLRKLAAENRPVAFLGLFGVPTVAAALPVLEELRIPAVGLMSGSDAVRTPLKRYAFPVRAGYADEARKLASHVHATGISRVAVIFMDNPFGQAQKNALLAALAGQTIATQELPLDTEGAATGVVVKQALARAPQAVFVITTARLAVPVLAALKQLSYRGATYGFSTLDASIVKSLAGGQAAGMGLTQVVPIPSGIRLKVVDEYLRALRSLGRGTPSFIGLEGYIEARVLAEGLRLAGPRPTPAALLRALESMQDLDVGGFHVSYSPTFHKGSSFVDVNVVNDRGDVMR